MSPAEEAAAAAVLADKNLKVEVWAAEPLLANPVAFCFDEKGRCYVAETFRHTHGVPDTRGTCTGSTTTSPAAPSPTASRCTRSTSTAQYAEEQRPGCGWCGTGRRAARPTRDSVFADGFNRTRTASRPACSPRKGDVYFTCIPDLYLLKDTKGDDKADVKKSLATGFGVRRAVHRPRPARPAHGAGRQALLLDRRPRLQRHHEGREEALQSRTAARCCAATPTAATWRSSTSACATRRSSPSTTTATSSPATTTPTAATGPAGSTSSRAATAAGACGYQYGTGYHTPGVPQGNRGPWNTEKLWLPQQDGQAAYIVPPLLNFGNGPAGITHYPGIGLTDKYKDHFFAATSPADRAATA